MLAGDLIDRVYYWCKKREWYEYADNVYAHVLTDKAPKKARESFEEYKALVDERVRMFGVPDTGYVTSRIEIDTDR